MVDPMFIIVQSSWSFVTTFTPTAVTTTAVASTVVILPGFTWIYLNFHEYIKTYLILPIFTYIYVKFTEFT